MYTVWTSHKLYACGLLQSRYPWGEGQLSTLAFDLVCKLVDLGEGVAVAVDEVRYLGGGVHDGRVVAAAEGLPNFGKGHVCQLAGEVHGDLARVGEAL